MKTFFLILLCFIYRLTFSQEFSLDTFLIEARKNYPLLKQKNIELEITQLQKQSLKSLYYPQINLLAQATYQSDVTSLPISIPGQNIETLSKDQYKAFIEITQNIYDGGTVSNQVKTQNLYSKLKNIKVDMSVQKIIDQVLETFFQILLLNENRKTLSNFKGNLQSNYEISKSGYENGIIKESQLNEISIELLRLEQQLNENQELKNYFIGVLKLLSGVDVNANIEIKRPELIEKVEADFSHRNEKQLFDIQKQILVNELKSKSITRIPKLQFFVQGGLGRPALNFLNNNFQLYYYGGLRFSWNLSSFYTFKKENKIMALKQNSLLVDNEALDISLQQAYNNLEAEKNKLLKFIELDTQILALSKTILETKLAEYNEGVATFSDYLATLTKQVNIEQTYVTHEIKYLITLYKQKQLTEN